MELINKVSEKLAASSSRETRASEGCPTRKRRRNCLEKSFRRIRPISRLDESTYKWTKRLQNIRIESCWLVNAANDGPQKRISSLPLFQSSLNHRPFLRPASCFVPETRSLEKLSKQSFPTRFPIDRQRWRRDWKTVKKFRDEYSEPIPILFLANGKRRVFSGNLKRRAVIGQRSRTRENFIPLELAKWRKGNIFLNPIEDRELCSNVWRVNPYRVLLSPWKTGKYRGLS